MSPDDTLLTEDQVAAYFGISRRTVARWVRDGILHQVKVKRYIRYRRDEVERLAGYKGDK